MAIDRELLYRFFSRSTTLDEEIIIRKWIEESEKNRVDFFRERKLFDAFLIHGTPRKKLSIDRYLFSWQKMVVVASSVAAIVLLTMIVTTDYLKQSYKNKPNNIVFVPQGQHVNLILADGTNVWLNAKTKMEYPQNFEAADRRIVKIDGEAYFEVTKNPKKPFIVQTPKGEVEALGTKFYVTAYTNSDKFETALIEGKVKVQTVNNRLILSPNNKAVLEKGQLLCQSIHDVDVYRWREGLYCFNEEDFQKVLKQFEIYYDVRFIKKDNDIPNSKITGKFRLVDGVDYALRVLQREVKFSYHRDEETNTIYISKK